MRKYSVRFSLNSSLITHHLSLIKDSLTHVALGPVGEERDDALACAEALCDSARRGGRSAGRAAAEDAFGARQFADCREGFRVGDCDDFVRRLPVEVGRDDLALAYAFEPVEGRLAAPEYRAFGLDERAVDFGVNLFDGARDARKSPGRAAPEDECVNAPFGLFKYLARGRLLVYERVRRVLELLRDEAAGRLGGQFARAPNSALHALLCGHVLYAPAKRLHNLHLLARVAFGHAQDYFVAARDADERQPDARVPGRRLDDGRALLQDSAALCVENHPQRGAGFDGGAGVHVFELRVEFRRGLGRELRKAQQRRAAHKVKDALDGPERRRILARTPRL